MKQLIAILLGLIVVAHLALYATNPAPHPRPRAPMREEPKVVTLVKNKENPEEFAYKQVPTVSPPLIEVIRWDTILYLTAALGIGLIAGRVWPQRKSA